MAGRGEEIPCKQGCGQTFTYESWRVRHELKCKGPISGAREGRIAARQRALVPVTAKKSRRASSRPGPAARRPVERRPNGEGAIVAAATDKAVEIVIAGLMAKRDAIDRAIAALEAVS